MSECEDGGIRSRTTRKHDKRTWQDGGCRGRAGSSEQTGLGPNKNSVRVLIDKIRRNKFIFLRLKVGWLEYDLKIPQPSVAF